MPSSTLSVMLRFAISSTDGLVIYRILLRDSKRKSIFLHSHAIPSPFPCFDNLYWILVIACQMLRS
jgi:hypothetical protein